MHHCIVKIGIELLADRLDRRDAEICQSRHELLVDLLHTLCERVLSILFSYQRESSLKVVNYRKDLLNDIFRSHRVHAGFFFFRSLPVVVELCHEPDVFLILLFDELVFLLNFFLQLAASEKHVRLLIAILSFMCGIFIICSLRFV